MMERRDVYSGNCTANEIRIHYWRTGGDKPPLIALHGLLANGACWMPIARHLEQEFDIIMPDSRGHGGSSAPAWRYGYDDLFRDVAGLVETLELPAPILLGHSMGGLAAALAAAELGTRIRALVLVDPTFIGPDRQREAYESAIVDEHRALVKLGKEGLVARARQRQPDRSLEILELLADGRLETSVRAFDVLTPPYPDYEALVRRVAVPTLLIIGSEGIVSNCAASQLEKANSHLSWTLIEGAGHGMPYDRPAEIAGIAKSFLRRVLV